MCAVCGESTPKSKTGPRATYCSRPCRRRAEYLRSKESGRYAEMLSASRKVHADRPCSECGVPFLAKRNDASFCSSACANRWRDRENPARCSMADCDRGVRAKGLCNAHYKAEKRAAGVYKPEPWSDRRRDNYQRRKALKKGSSTGLQVLKATIAERDRWHCHLCGEKVEDSLRWPNPLSASLDHVVPLSRGGAHDPANVRLAHLGCNVRKGAGGGGEQLLLVG